VKFFELQIHIKYFAIHGKAFQIYECSYCAPSFFCVFCGLFFLKLIWFWLCWKRNFAKNTFRFARSFFSPFIHADMEHLYNNSVPTYLLAALQFFYKIKPWKLSYFIFRIDYLDYWQKQYHIGASGLIYVLVCFF
jgi:hypothetical protein